MPTTLVWDIPTRLFHWLLAAGFAVAAAIGFLVDDESPLFPWHAMIGLAIALMVCLRVLWGVFGSRHARFSSFAYGPAAVARYLKAVLLGNGETHAGHNPGSAYAVFAMLLLVIGLAATGIMLGRGMESVKEVHEVLAYVMLGIVAAHVLGVLVHTIRRRENIVASMIHGRKNVDPAEGIRSSHPAAAAAFLIVAGAWSFGLVRNFDPATQTTKLPILGASLQIGEAEHAGGDDDATRERHHDDDD